MFLLVLAHPGSPGQRAVKRLLLCCCTYIKNEGTEIGASNTTVNSGCLLPNSKPLV